MDNFTIDHRDRPGCRLLLNMMTLRSPIEFVTEVESGEVNYNSKKFVGFFDRHDAKNEKRAHDLRVLLSLYILLLSFACTSLFDKIGQKKRFGPFGKFIIF